MTNLTTTSLSILALSLSLPGQDARAAQAGLEVRIVKDVAYLPAERSEKLDLYFPPGHDVSRRAPAIVIIHGGGWYAGDKGRAREVNIGTTLARAGYVCASINYALGKARRQDDFATKLGSIWPKNLNDCKTAVSFLRVKAEQYGIDPTRIGAIGGSAGGHLAAMLGYTDEDDGYGGLYAARQPSYVSAVVSMYGPHDLVFRAKYKGLGKAGGKTVGKTNGPDLDGKLDELCRRGSTVTYLTPDDPPTLILHGTADTTVDIKQSELLAAACRRVGIEFQFDVLEGVGHTFDLQPSGYDLRPRVIAFFDRYLKGKGKPASIPRELRRERLTVDGRPAFMIWPTAPRTDGKKPWVMYAPTLGERYPGTAEVAMFRYWLQRGIAIAGVDVGESYGNAAGRATYTALYNRLTSQHGFASKAALLARSRGGLMLYNWAVEHPDKVASVAGIYPVCNLTSYPGLRRACGAYGMTEAELADVLKENNPVDRIDRLARANVPIYHIHGDADKVVPLDVNSRLLRERYVAAGGVAFTLKIVSGQGHNMWSGFFEHQPLIDFVVEHSGK